MRPAPRDAEEQTLTDQSMPAFAQAAIRYWWLFLLQGLVALVVGALLVFKSDKTVAFVAVLLGIYVVLWGLVQIICAFAINDRRLLHGLAGVAAIAVGGLVIGDPDRTVRLVAVAVGVYLIIWGAVALLSLFGERPDKAVRVIQGLLAAAAGIVVVALPGHGIKFVAIVLGLWLIITAIAEIFGSLRLKRLASAQGPSAPA